MGKQRSSMQVALSGRIQKTIRGASYLSPRIRGGAMPTSFAAIALRRHHPALMLATQHCRDATMIDPRISTFSIVSSLPPKSVLGPVSELIEHLRTGASLQAA